MGARITAILLILVYILALFAPIGVVIGIYLYTEYMKTYGSLE